MPPPGRACIGASRHTSSATLMRSRWAREGVPLIVIQRQLGHTNLGITSIYLQGIDSTEIIDTVHARRPPMIPVDATLRT
jgi:integrase